MKIRSQNHLLETISLSATLMIGLLAPTQGQPSDSTTGKKSKEATAMTDEALAVRCEEMRENMRKMMADTKAQDGNLAEQVAKMNAATGAIKVELMAALITQMVERQTAMHERKAVMEKSMAKHMMEHMQMRKGQMMNCPMMGEPKKGSSDPDEAKPR